MRNAGAELTLPKMVCFLSSHGHLSSVMKNCTALGGQSREARGQAWRVRTWLELVFGLPELAMASWPRWLKERRLWNSSLKSSP